MTTYGVLPDGKRCRLESLKAGDGVGQPEFCMRHGYGDGIDTAVSIVSARLEEAQPYLSERENTPLSALMPNLRRSANSVGGGRYSDWKKCTGTFGDAEP